MSRGGQRNGGGGGQGGGFWGKMGGTGVAGKTGNRGRARRRWPGCAAVVTLSARIDLMGTVGPDIQSAMDGLLSEAVGLLLSKKGDIDEAVHDARKNLKAFRSYLRLLRAIIGKDYVALNVQARDAARFVGAGRQDLFEFGRVGA